MIKRRQFGTKSNLYSKRIKYGKKGKVLLSTSLGYQVHLSDGNNIIAPRRKNLDIRKGNIIIGDIVSLDDNNQIFDISPRKT